MVSAASATHVAYIDESYGSRSRRRLVLSACVAPSETWKQFNEEWGQVLQSSPSISAFHMREARARNGCFKGWKAIDVDYKIINLTEVIVRHHIRIVTCWVDEDDYKETIGSKTPSDFRNPYFVCFEAMVIGLARVQRALGISTPVDYVFDEKGDPGDEALFWYEAIKESVQPEIRRRMGSAPVFRDDEKVVPLQAADLVAWRYRRLLETTASDPELASSMRLDELGNAEFPITRHFLEQMWKTQSSIPNVSEFSHVPSIYKMVKRFDRKE